MAGRSNHMPLLQFSPGYVREIGMEAKTLELLPRVVAPSRNDILFVPPNNLIDRTSEPALDVQIDPSQPIDREISKKIGACRPSSSSAKPMLTSRRRSSVVWVLGAGL